MSQSMPYSIELRTPLTPDLVREVLARLAYIDELITRSDFLPAKNAILLDLRGAPDDARLLQIREKVERAVSILVANARPWEQKIVRDNLDRKIPYAEDPLPILIARGEAVEELAGVYTLGPTFSYLIRYFHGRFLTIADKMGALPYHFPALIPAAYLEKVRYFKNFPHSLTLVTHLREDLDAIERFSNSAVIAADGKLNLPGNELSQISCLLSPTVCHHLYLALQNRTISVDPFIATSTGNCFRYESINMHGIERLWNFSMWELMFVGTSDAVNDGITRTYEAAGDLFDEWGLAYRVENANDPFFVGEFAVQSLYQRAHDLKYEFRARLPYNGGTLAVGSRNYHKDFFGRTMKIELKDGGIAHTGCVGFGLERLAFAFLAQYGPDPVAWPANVRNESGVRSVHS